MAPEIPYLTKANPQYQKYINSLEGYYDFIAPQFYNQGAFGIGFQPDDTTKDGWWVNYAQNDDSKKNMSFSTTSAKRSLPTSTASLR